MRYERERSVPRRPQVLVVSAPGDPRAIRLSDDLQDAGWRVILADTPDIAEDYAESAFCVVVLRARQWNAPAIAAAVRARPVVLIPVLAEPMDLPRGPWTFEPIPMDSPRQVVAEVAEALDDAARAQRGSAGRGPGGSYPPREPVDSFSGARGGVGYQRESRGPIDRGGTTYGRGAGDPFGRSMPNRPSVRVGATTAPPPAKKSSAGRGIGIAVSLLVLAGLIFGGIKYGYPYVKRHYLTGSPTAVPQPAAYTANLPGPGCDTGTGKNLWQFPANSAYTGACQTAGYTLTQNSNPTQVGEVFFKDRAAFPRAYQVQVTATTQGDANIAVGVDVHHQANSGGGYLFGAYGDGEWHGILEADTIDKIQRLALGFLAKPSNTYQMLVDVQGPVMTFSVNGTKVGTITDGTYRTTDAVGFFLLDYGDTKAATATFSQFSYMPEQNPPLSGDSILATATAQTTAQAKQPYSAAVPGFGCDTGNGAWAPAYLLPSLSPGTTFQCTSGGLVVNQAATNGRGAVPFFGPNGILRPNDYTVAVQVAPKSATDCGGVFTRATKDGSYGFRVCGDGTWVIYTVVKGVITVLQSGNVSPATTYTLAATSKGTSQSLSIGGATVATVTDKTNSQTTFVALNIRVADGSAGSVTFSKFSFTAIASS